MIDSLREDKSLKVHLVTKSIIEMLRAEVDGITTIELKEIITTVDLWVLITPYDDVTDFRNASEDNLEFITTAKPMFSQAELLELKDECHIMNLTNF